MPIAMTLCIQLVMVDRKLLIGSIMIGKNTDIVMQVKLRGFLNCI